MGRRQNFDDDEDEMQQKEEASQRRISRKWNKEKKAQGQSGEKGEVIT
jgi:hypothetical protein